MVMGPTHAVSGAAVWLLGGATAAQALGVHWQASQVVVGAVVCGGSALLPDIDCPTSTVARFAGPVSHLISELVDAVSATVYNATRSRKYEEHRDSGHRTLTHTSVMAVAAGLGTAALCSTYGTAAVLVVLYVTLALAVRGLMHDWAAHQGWIAVTGLTAAGTYLAYRTLPPHAGYGWLGAAVGVGAFMHLLGDMITKKGCPLAWPVPVGGRRWYEIALPGLLRIRADGLFEKLVLLPALVVLLVVGAIEAVPGGRSAVDDVTGSRPAPSTSIHP